MNPNRGELKISDFVGEVNIVAAPKKLTITQEVQCELGKSKLNASDSEEVSD